MRLSTSITLTLAVLTLAAPTHAQELSASGIRGRVIDAQTGQPLIGAYVEISGTEHSTYTTRGGAFYINVVPAGEVTLTASQIGYTDLSVTLTLKSGQDLQFELDPQPFVLEGITVHQSRLEQRRKAAPISSRAISRDVLALSSATNTLDFVARQSGLTVVPCANTASRSVDTDPADFSCVLSRGRSINARVYIDERRATLDELRAYQTHEFYTMEVYGRTHIRLYTLAYMDRVAKGRDRIGLFPIMAW